jgi:DNA invertase Pin-like site-specific DNA recombinase
MKVGYARTSTRDQVAGLEAQITMLKEAGVEKIYQEQVSSVRERAQLNSAIEFVREGDTLVVTKLDRLARSVRDLLNIIESLQKKGCGFTALNTPIDTETSSGRLQLQILGAVAESEREIMLERQRDGIARAKSLGKYKGRIPTARRKKPDVLALKVQGYGATDIADKLQIGRSSVYRILAEKA